MDGGSAVMKRPSFLSVLSGAYSLEMIEPVSKIELSRYVGGCGFQDILVGVAVKVCWWVWLSRYTGGCGCQGILVGVAFKVYWWVWLGDHWKDQSLTVGVTS